MVARLLRVAAAAAALAAVALVEGARAARSAAPPSADDEEDSQSRERLLETSASDLSDLGDSANDLVAQLIGADDEDDGGALLDFAASEPYSQPQSDLVAELTGTAGRLGPREDANAAGAGDGSGLALQVLRRLFGKRGGDRDASSRSDTVEDIVEESAGDSEIEDIEYDIEVEPVVFEVVASMLNVLDEVQFGSVARQRLVEAARHEDFAVFEGMAEELFDEADQDGDGLLNAPEVDGFVDLLRDNVRELLGIYPAEEEEEQEVSAPESVAQEAPPPLETDFPAPEDDDDSELLGMEDIVHALEELSEEVDNVPERPQLPMGLGVRDRDPQFQRLVGELFARADEDGDGALNAQEAETFAELLGGHVEIAEMVDNEAASDDAQGANGGAAD